jgi:hypothetical protein
MTDLRIVGLFDHNLTHTREPAFATHVMALIRLHV